MLGANFNWCWISTVRCQVYNIHLRECQSLWKAELSILWSSLLLLQVVGHPIWRQGSFEHLSQLHSWEWSLLNCNRWGWSWQSWLTGKGKRTQSWILMSGVTVPCVIFLNMFPRRMEEVPGVVVLLQHNLVLRNSACSFNWLSSSIFTVRRCSSRIRDTSSDLHYMMF